MADSSRFEKLQKASTRDVKAVGMVAASTGLEMVEYIRELETLLNKIYSHDHVMIPIELDIEIAALLGIE